MTKVFQFINLIIIICLFNACTPKYDWREIKNVEPVMRVYFPAKPIEHTKQVYLGDIKKNVTMIAAEVNGVNFALAFIKTDEQNSQKMIQLMQNGMVKNIQGVLLESKIKNTIFARGNDQNGKPKDLYARFVIKKNWAIQAVVIGEEKKLTTEILSMFFDSLQLE